MKRLIASILIATSGIAYAGPHYHNSPTVGGMGVWPLIVGGTIGYVIANQQKPVVVQSAPVVVQPPIYTNSSPVYNLPQAPYSGATPLYEKRTQFDPNCNCYIVVYNQIGWQ